MAGGHVERCLGPTTAQLVSPKSAFIRRRLGSTLRLGRFAAVDRTEHVWMIYPPSGTALALAAGRLRVAASRSLGWG